jgi:hypothetical protein
MLRSFLVSQGRSPHRIPGWRFAVVLRGVLLVLAVYSVSTAAILVLIGLPEAPLLRYAVFIVPLIAAVVVLTEGYERRTPQAGSMPEQEAVPSAAVTRELAA